jgi:L-arabinose isomerase
LKVKVGFLPVACKYFLDNKMLDFDNPNSEYGSLIWTDFKKMLNLLSKYFVVVEDGIIYSEEQSHKVIDLFKEEKVDLLITSNILWAEDYLLLDVVKELEHLPLLNWIFSPYYELKKNIKVEEFLRGCGPCGAYQVNPGLQRIKKNIKYIFGYPDDKKIIKEIEDYYWVIKTIKELKNKKIAHIPSGWDIQTDIDLDKFKLYKKIGPKVIHYVANDLKEVFDRVNNKEAEELFNYYKSNYGIIDVSDNTLKIASKAAVGLANFADENNIGAISYNENSADLHRVMKLNPSLYYKGIYANNRVVGMEGDLLTITASMILKHLSNGPVMFTEILNIDRKNNLILSGHPGNHDMIGLTDENSDIRIVPDYEWKNAKENIHGLEGAWMHFSAKKGDITICELIYDDNDFKLIFSTGYSTGEKTLADYSQANIKVPFNIDEFIIRSAEAGFGHHFTFCYGNQKNKLIELSKLLNIKAIDLEKDQERVSLNN